MRTHYRNKLTGEEVALTAAAEDRFFDNRSPFEWERVEEPASRTVYEPYPGAFDHILGPEAPRTLREFVTDEVEA
ncbi:hypothetical protein EYE35_01280 [Cereibacter sphaeroides]|nr:hypothetical protein EYE35_01280 [Cereibacter sphaeroides]